MVAPDGRLWHPPAAMPSNSTILFALFITSTGCATPLSSLQGSDRTGQLQGMAALQTASDADKAAAVPRLIELSESKDAEVRTAAWQAMDSLHFADARLGWQVAASKSTLCKRTISSVKARWSEVDNVVRDGLVQAMAGGRCSDVEDWIWELVEQTDTLMERGSGLYGWLDARRDSENTGRLLTLARNPGTSAGRVGPICELLAARASSGMLEGTDRPDALQLVHDTRVGPGVRTVLGEAIFGGQPPIQPDVVLTVLIGSEAPSELRKRALLALPSGGVATSLSANTVSTLGKVITDPASPPDLRAHFAAVLSQRGKADALIPLSKVAEDVGTNRDLRSKMLEQIASLGGEEAAGVMAKVVVQTQSHPETRAQAMAALETVWSGTAEYACVKVCEAEPTSELCASAIARLTGHGSARVPDAKAFGFSVRIDEIADPYAMLKLRGEMGAPVLNALNDQVRAYALTLAAVAKADKAAVRRFGDDEDGKKIDPAICTMRDGRVQVAELKAAGKKAEALAIQRSMYRAEHLLKEDAVKAKIKAAKRTMKAALAEAGAAAIPLNAVERLARLDKMIADKVGLKAPCMLTPLLAKARRNAKRGN